MRLLVAMVEGASRDSASTTVHRQVGGPREMMGVSESPRFGLRRIRAGQGWLALPGPGPGTITSRSTIGRRLGDG